MLYYKNKSLLRSSLFFLLTFVFSLSFANTRATGSKNHIKNIEKPYSQNVAKRVRRLKSLILKYANYPAKERLVAVNTFFNDVQWVSDLSHWGKSDYWQTPQETLVKFKGDCEDVAIAKYAALRKMGIPDERLAIVYVMKKGRPHMVLAYYESERVDPIVLDGSDNPTTTTASRRKDLRSVYSFNSTSLWLTDQNMNKLGSGRPVPDSHKLSRLQI